MASISIYLKDKICYLTLCVLFIICCTLLCVLYSKGASFELLRPITHSALLQALFSIITFWGNGYFAVALCLSFIAFNKTSQLGIRLLFAFILSGLLAQIIKKLNLLQDQVYYLMPLNTIYTKHMVDSIAFLVGTQLLHLPWLL